MTPLDAVAGMSGLEETIVRLVEAAGAVVASILAWRAKVHAKHSRHQVENDHGTNLRADLDGIAASVDQLADSTADGLRSLGHQLGEVRRDMDAERRIVDGRLSRLEAGRWRRR